MRNARALSEQWCDQVSLIPPKTFVTCFPKLVQSSTCMTVIPLPFHSKDGSFLEEPSVFCDNKEWTCVWEQSWAPPADKVESRQVALISGSRQAEAFTVPPVLKFVH